MKHRRVGLALLMAFALGAGVLTPQALADSNARIVRLSYVEGDVQIDRRDGRGFERAFLNMPLAPGTQVTTRDDGRAEIEFEDMSTLRLAPDSLVQTQSLDLRSSGGKYTLVDLQDGTAYFNIRTLEGDDDFRVTVGRREFSLTRSSRFRLRVDRAQVVLAVFQGEVEITDESGRLTVRKNETLTLDLDDPSRYFLAKGVEQDRYDDWDRERDEYRNRYSETQGYRGYSSAYSYGVADLNYWGSYTYYADYGYMWRPHYYGIGWNPYSHGGWYWYPGYGWIWVSAYPWGWMPFHYGNWYYISGHGWCWRPGRHWNHWSPVVAVHNPPAGQVVPTPPPPTARRDPVLVGRGPTTILPPEDPGPGRRRRERDLDATGRRGGNPAVSSGSVVVGAPAAGSGVVTSGGSGVTVISGSGSGGAVGPGRVGQSPVGSQGRGREREIDLEDAIRDARERRSGSGQSASAHSGGVITNSGPAPSSGSASSGGSGDVSPSSGRTRVPESRRQLPESRTRDSVTPGADSGGSSRSGYSGGSGPDSADRYSSGGRSTEVPRASYGSSGSSGSASSSSAGSSRTSSGSSGGGGSSYHSSSSSGSSSGSGHSSAGSSGGGSSSSSSGGGSSSGASRSSSGGHSSSSGSSGSSGSRSSGGSTPK